MGRALVTGAGGFIGSHLCEELVKRGENVRAFVHYNAAGTWGLLETLPQNVLSEIEVVQGDIRDLGLGGGVYSAAKDADVVYHLAALISIPYSYHSPEAYLDTNIKGTLNMLQTARALETPRLLITSTSEVYGTAQYTPMDEKHPYQGQSPYSASKIGADRMAESFYRSFQVPLTIVRPFNTYGPRQSARAVIPTIISQLLGGCEELHLGSLLPTRDFNFVKDTAAGFIALAESKEAIGQEVNIATGVEVSIGDLAKELIFQINPNARIVCDNERIRPEMSEVFRLCGDNTKISAMTPWKPQYDLKQGLGETIAWIKDNLNVFKTGRYNI